MTGSMADLKQTQEAEIIDLFKKIKPSDSLQELREAAIHRFEALKFPHKKHEMYTFANVKELATTSFVLAKEGPIDSKLILDNVYPSCKNSFIVFVNGFFHEGLSNISSMGTSIKLIDLNSATLDKTLHSYLLETNSNENDVFATLNGAFSNGGLLVDVAENATFEQPLQIVYVSHSSSPQPMTSHPRLLIRLGKSAELKLIVKFLGCGEKYFVNCVQDFLVEENAGLTYSQIQQDNANAWHCSKTRANIKRNGRFISSNASSGNRLTRHHYEVHLKDEGAEAQLNGASVLINEEQVHNFVRIHHEAPHCTSQQLFRNVINHKGRSSFDGTVIVNKGAQLTYSDQLINNLMLSDEAHADNKPNLMIFADDVKCTHGATVGQIDEDQLFYLKTRGLSEELAQSLLTKSFVETVIQTIPFPEVREDLDDILLKKLEANHG